MCSYAFIWKDYHSFFLDNLLHNFFILNKITENILVFNKKIKAVIKMIGNISLNENFSNSEKSKSFKEKNNIINAAINTSHFF